MTSEVIRSISTDNCSYQFWIWLKDLPRAGTYTGGREKMGANSPAATRQRPRSVKGRCKRAQAARRRGAAACACIWLARGQGCERLVRRPSPGGRVPARRVRTRGRTQRSAQLRVAGSRTARRLAEKQRSGRAERANGTEKKRAVPGFIWKNDWKRKMGNGE